MAMPKTGARRIVVSGEPYLWRVRPRHPEADDRGWGWSFAVQHASQPGSTLVVHLIRRHPLWDSPAKPVVPAEVADCIREALSSGWQPSTPGTAFHMQRGMDLSADVVFAQPAEDDYPINVGFRDTTADYCVVLSRFSSMTPDRGTINVLVRDQVHTETANLALQLSRTWCHVQVDAEAASALLGVPEYMIQFQADDATYQKMVELLRAIFAELPGLTIVE